MSILNSQPVFICIPGASHTPVIYEPLKVALESYNYTCIPLALPSVGGDPPTYDFTQDVRAIRECVTQIVDSGVDVIMVFHGYGGLPGAEALQGLDKGERSRRGFRGGVVRLVFIMSYLAVEGFQGSPRGDISSVYPYMRCNLKTNTYTIAPHLAIPAFYGDLPPTIASHYASLIQPQSLGVLWSKTTYAAWRYIPTTYVICGQDQSMAPAYAEMILDKARANKPNLIDTVERCEGAAHCVMLSRVEWCRDMLRRAAGERC